MPEGDFKNHHNLLFKNFNIFKKPSNNKIANAKLLCEGVEMK